MQAILTVMMQRRNFLGLSAAAVLWPVTARAQQKAMPVIGILGATSPENRGVQLNLAGFREGLAQTGFVEGQNVAIEYRWAERHFDRLPALAAELVGRKVDVIVTEGGDSTTFAGKQATSSIPVVFHSSSDPVALSIVASLARPGGNLTGVSMLTGELVPKLFELLLELVPGAKLIGLLRDPNSALDIRDVAAARNVGVHVLPAVTDSEVDEAFAALVKLPLDGVIAYTLTRARIAALALRNSLPAVSYARDFSENGGLLSYGPSLPDAYRIKGIYTGRILKGEKAADLPVQQPNKFELLINLKTAKALGLTVPHSLLQRADEVIE
jgi:putative ABC transport system substrate-binding protein